VVPIGYSGSLKQEKETQGGSYRIGYKDKEAGGPVYFLQICLFLSSSSPENLV